MKKQRKVKKYLTGTKVINPHGSIDEVLEQDRINLAQAKYESEANVWTNMLDLAGSTLMNVGMSGAAKSLKGGDSTGSDFWDGLIKDGSLSKLGNAVQIGMKTFEDGGEVENEIPIEAEDGELYEEPDGTVGEFEGNTHDEADPNTGETGVQTTKPEGTMIYSDRIMVGNKSVAQKKKARVKAMTSLEKKLENNPTDILLKNTIEQTKRNHKIEERADLRVQKFSEALSKISGDLTNYSKKKYYAGTSYLTDDPITPEEKVDGDPTIEEWLKTSEGWVDGSKEDEGEDVTMPWTLGDTVGTIGTAISTFGPWLKTMKSRGEDIPYTNPIKENYGEKGLKAVADAKDMSTLSRDEALKKVQSNKMAAMQRAGKTSRGLRTQEAFKVGADTNANTAISEIYSGWSQDMMKLFGMEGTLGDKADLLKMQGEASAIEKNKEQKDNFDTQQAQNIANIGTGIQKFAGDLNKNKQNKDFLSMLKNYSSAGVYFDPKDGWKLKDDSSKEKEKGRDKILKGTNKADEEIIKVAGGDMAEKVSIENEDNLGGYRIPKSIGPTAKQDIIKSKMALGRHSQFTFDKKTRQVSDKVGTILSDEEVLETVEYLISK